MLDRCRGWRKNGQCAQHGYPSVSSAIRRACDLLRDSEKAGAFSFSTRSLVTDAALRAREAATRHLAEQNRAVDRCGSNA